MHADISFNMSDDLYCVYRSFKFSWFALKTNQQFPNLMVCTKNKPFNNNFPIYGTHSFPCPL